MIKIRNLTSILEHTVQKVVMGTMMEYIKVIISLAREVPRIKENLYYQPHIFDLNAKKVSIIADRNLKNAPQTIKNNICLSGWGSSTEWSAYTNIKNEKIFCEHPDQSYIVQAYSRWTDRENDDKQIKWHCSPPDSSNNKKETPHNIVDSISSAAVAQNCRF